MVKKALAKVFGDPQTKTLKRLTKKVASINTLEDTYSDLTIKQLKEKLDVIRKDITDGKTDLDKALPDVFAIVRAASVLILGMRHFDVQLIGGMALHEGSVAEMRTGEGKTLVATLPIILNALEGKGAHLVTVNDYLVKRDAGWMGELYDALGLSIGIIAGQDSFIYDRDYEAEDQDDDRFKHLKPTVRQVAYEADITYGTNNEYGFDYLRDNMVREVDQLRQRPLHYAIVDEVDSILIDEARTPLIISASASQSGNNYSRFASIVKQLKEEHYEKDEKRRSATLTDEGVLKVQSLLGIENLYAAESLSYIYHLEQALKAELLFKRDKDYVVDEKGEVLIVDEFTGRMMVGRRYSEGLHQAIEAKEGVEVQQESMTLATISFQNYFRLYNKLSGMTGTAETESEEFFQIYKLDVVVIPTNMPSAREDMPDRIYKSQTAKFKAIVSRVKELQETGQPVLIGTASIEKNELLSDLLSKSGVTHSVLNAKQHESEAAVVARAGQPGSVTLATNIAGRGTDIVLGEGVVGMGGLFVLGSERHESRRIDNQLRGRAGRQGDPGMTQFYVASDDDLMRIFGGERIGTLMDRLGVDEDTPIENRALSKALENAQKKVESHNFDSRKHVVSYDDVMNRHRKAIYTLRHSILAGEDLHSELDIAVDQLVKSYTPLENEKLDRLVEEIEPIFALDEKQKKLLVSSKHDEFNKQLQEVVTDKLKKQEKVFGKVDMGRVIRDLYLQILDSLWMQHLENMSHLREGIKWRQVGQKDPLVEYRREGQKMFLTLQHTMRLELMRGLIHAVPVEEESAEPIETELTRAARRAEIASNKNKEEAKVKTNITRRAEAKSKENVKNVTRNKRKQQRRNRKKNRR